MHWQLVYMSTDVLFVDRLLRQVGLALPGLRPIQVSCTAYNCAIRLDSSTTDCRGVKCDCSDGSCQGLDSLVDQLDSAAIDCQETGACNITIGGLPITKFPVTCLSGECVVASATGNFQGNYVEESDLDWDRIGIACIGFLPTAVMVVVLALAALLARASMTCTCAPRLRGSLLQSDIKLLSFQGLTVTVPQKRAMRRESGDAGPRTEGTGSEGPIPVAESILASSPSSYHSNKGFQNVDLALDEEAGASFSSKRPAPSAAGRRRQILSGVTFTAQRGEVLAIMGPSGSGKTTLLSILAAREGDLGNGALVEGAILIDGVKRKQRTFRSTCAFVPQVCPTPIHVPAQGLNFPRFVFSF